MQLSHNFENHYEKTKHYLSSELDSQSTASLMPSFLKKLARLLYQPYKWLIFIPFLGISTLTLFPFALLTALFFGPNTCSKLFPPIWSRMNCWMTPIQVHVSGAERVAPDQSYVVVANHQSFYDIFIIYGWLGIDIKWVMKAELRKVPIIGYICKKMDHIFIDRSDGETAIESINRAKQKISNGTSVIFFPEGTRSADGAMGPFKKGAFRLAVDMGLPILPVTICGTKDILPKGTMDLFPGKAAMIIHPPIDVGKYGHDKLASLMERTRQTIASAQSGHLV